MRLEAHCLVLTLCFISTVNFERSTGIFACITPGLSESDAHQLSMPHLTYGVPSTETRRQFTRSAATLYDIHNDVAHLLVRGMLTIPHRVGWWPQLVGFQFLSVPCIHICDGNFRPVSANVP